MSLRKALHIAALLAVVLSTVLGAGTARADGVIVIDPPWCDPFCAEPVYVGDQLVVRNHHVDVTIDNQVATTRIDQTFLNQNDWVAEGTYLFPVPDGASISQFSMIVDGQEIEATLLEAEEARKIYEEIVRNMKDPALLEYIGRNVIQARIFPIEPGQEREIQIEYQQLLTVENGLVQYTYPLNTERFSAEPLEQASVRVEVISGDPVRAIYSPSHQIAVDRKSDTHFVAGWEESDVRPDTDFELIYTVSSEAIGANLLSSWDPVKGEGTFLLLAAPGIDVDEQTVSKDIIVVLDTSGSMEGEKIEQAKEALIYVLEQLNEGDRFTIIEFSTGVRLYDDKLVGIDEVKDAIRWVKRLQADGGTNIDEALTDAMDLADAERPTYLLFLTDGLPTEGETNADAILDNVEDAAADNVRLFSFGVGDDVDTILLDTLSQEHHGATTYVRPGQQLDETIAAFYGKISSPVLIDVEVTIDGVRTEEIYPSPLPDIFAGTQLVIVGKYTEPGAVTITITGEVNGERRSFVYEGQELSDERGSGASKTLPRLWATRKVGYLLNQIRINGENEEWIQAVVDLSVEFGIVTPYTSYLITEDDILTTAGRDQVAQAEYDQAVATAAPRSGEEAVDAAFGAGALAGADNAAPMAVETESGGAMRAVGSRAFVLQDGVWIETIFDPSTMETVQVEFLSDEYFALLASNPDLAEAFALGDQVIAFSDGTFYEVVVAD
ncbi:MAG: VWA domain-containing protein [Thermomicrobiales bacterium]|nr:VWA domain-containing protein [Thermomicrobiales bacterium]